MSRLDSFIRRLEAQRACLNFALDEIRSIDGPILEFGLGNGRSYDHLRERAPAREIYVFDRVVAAHPDCIPPERYLIFGDLFETLARAAPLIGAPAALAHLDIGAGLAASDRKLSELIARHLPDLLARGAMVVSDQRVAAPALGRLRAPNGVAEDRYFLYRAGGAKGPA